MNMIWLYAEGEQTAVWMSSLSVLLPEAQFTLRLIDSRDELLPGAALNEALLETTTLPDIVLYMGEGREPALTKISRLCRQNGVPVMIAGQRGAVFQIGPGVQPQKQGCLACWGWQGEYFHSAVPNAAWQVIPPETQLRLAQHLAQQFVTTITQGNDSPLAKGQYIQIDLEDHSQRWYTFLKNPACPVCSTWRWWPSETYVAAVG